eukprot:gene9810-7698_t
MEVASTSGDFAYPFFFSYPPYFTLQPVKDTRDKQSGSWGQLVLSWCRAKKVYIICVDEETPIFHNPSINRKLTPDARFAFLDDLVSIGSAEWLDKTKRRCLILWRKIPEWAAAIQGFVQTYGLGDTVMTLDELSSGDDVRGTDLYGLDREIFVRALKLLELQGKVSSQFMLEYFNNGEDRTEMAAPNDPKKVFCYRERSTIHSGLTRFYSSTKFSDITIVAPDGQKIFVHQVVLASCSKRFADVLEQGSLNGEELPVRGVDPTGLESVLKFFYTGECNLDHTNVIPVYDAAHRLDVPGLSAACEQFMRDILGPATACMLLQQTVQFLMQDYAEQCMTFIRGSFEEATSTEDFLSINFQTLTRILADASAPGVDGLPAHPDLTVYKAAWRWGISEASHMLYLPEILKLVKVPEVSMEELVKLVPPPVPTLSSEGEEGAVGEAPHSSPPPGSTGSLHQLLIEEMMSSNDLAASCAKVATEATAISNANAAAAAAAAPAGGHHSAGLAGGMVMQAGDKQQGGSVGGQMGGSGGALPPGFSGGAQPQLMLNQPAGEQQMDAQGNYPRLRLEPLRMGGSMDGNVNSNGQAGGGNFPMGGTLVLQPFNQGGGTPGSQSQGLLTPQLPMGTPASNRSHNSGTKGVCQVDDCYQDLTGLRDYHVRYKICETHLKAPYIHKDGHPNRFCQQCGRFHHLEEFDGEKRSCRARLQKHNARRRKKADGDMGDGQSSPKHQRMMEGGDMMHHAFSGGFNASLQYQDYLPMQGGGGMIPGVGVLGMGMPPRLSPAALSMLADAAQQDGGNGAATAAALSALGALAAAPSDDGSASMMMAMAGQGMLGQGGSSSAEDAARVEQTQQMLADFAAGNGMAAWQGALRAVAATMGSANGNISQDGDALGAGGLHQGGGAGGVDASSLDLLDLIARTTAAAAAAGGDTGIHGHGADTGMHGHGADTGLHGHGADTGTHAKAEGIMDDAHQHSLHQVLQQAADHPHDSGDGEGQLLSGILILFLLQALVQHHEGPTIEYHQMPQESHVPEEEQAIPTDGGGHQGHLPEDHQAHALHAPDEHQAHVPEDHQAHTSQDHQAHASEDHQAHAPEMHHEEVPEEHQGHAPEVHHEEVPQAMPATETPEGAESMQEDQAGGEAQAVPSPPTEGDAPPAPVAE